MKPLSSLPVRLSLVPGLLALSALGGTAVAGEKVEICHQTSGENESVLIDVSSSALDTHLDHGDWAVAADDHTNDGIDDDCDGEIDEDYVAAECPCFSVEDILAADYDDIGWLNDTFTDAAMDYYQWPDCDSDSLEFSGTSSSGGNTAWAWHTFTWVGSCSNTLTWEESPSSSGTLLSIQSDYDTSGQEAACAAVIAEAVDSLGYLTCY